MFKHLKHLFTVSAIIVVLSMFLSACGGSDGNAGNDGNAAGTGEGSGDELAIGQKDLTVPYVAWARETISTYMLAILLEKVGYNVDVRQVEAGPMYSSVASGSADFHTSAWLPATHASYWEEYEDDLVKANQVLDRAPLALTVPSYVTDINSMEDLKTNKQFGDAVGWKIIGIDGGAGIMENTRKALEAYGLDQWTLVTSSETAMLTELKSAYEKKEPIIVPLWMPHWAFGDMDLKMLEDPKGIYGGEGDQIYTVARKGLKEDAPRAYKVLEQYYETYDMLDEMMPKVYVDDRDPKEVAQEFIDNHPELVAEWLDGIPTE